MNTTASFRNNAWNNFNWLLAALALALTVPVREASGQGPAQVYTGPADCITATSATLNGHFSLYLTGSVWGAFGFNWGTTTNYGSSLTTFQGGIGGPDSFDFVGDVSGLSPGTTYHYSAWGTPGGSGGDKSFTTLGSRVSTLPATGVSTNGATLNGNVNPNGLPSTAWFQWGATTNYGNLTPVTGMGSGTNALPLSAALPGLTPGVTYHFRIAATNDYGLVYGSDQSFTTLGPPQVSTLPATGVSTNGATLNGTVNPNRLPATAWFQWGATTNYGNLSPGTDMGSGTNAAPLSAPLAGLTPNVTYHFRVAATNDYGQVCGNDQSFTAAGGSPLVWTGPPTGVSADSATLNGTVNPNDWPTAAWFEWGASTNYGNLTAMINLGSGTNALPLSVRLTGLTSGITGITYHYRVAATNSPYAVYGNDQSFTTGSFPFTDVDWVGLGPGVNDQVFSLAVSGTNLYAGGNFSMAGGVPASGIAKWDGRAWSALGEGLNGGPYSLAVSGTNLYAGGNLNTAGGLARGIAKWDGSTWSSLGSGLSSTTFPYVRALALDGVNLYVGGNFTMAGGVTAANIAKWDGSAWSALGSGMNSDVCALTVSGTNLYAGGYFTTADGLPVNYIAKWDGRAWSALGSGMSSWVAALAMIGTNLYAGGGFTMAGGIPVDQIAKWDGVGWSALSPRMLGGGVMALTVSRTDLYVGGQCTAANNIAKWDGSDWSSLGQGVGATAYQPYVAAMAADGLGRLFVGGYFTMAGGHWISYLAQANVGIGPTVLTLPATAIAPASASLNGTVNPNAYPTSAWFQWGTTTDYGQLTAAAAMGSGTSPLPLSAPLVGLTLGVTYHFRTAATNDHGLVYGSDQSFTTSPWPTVMTLPATGVFTNSATLNGTVNPNGWPTTAWFQWGATTNYGNLTAVTDLGTGTTTLPFSAQLAGLTLSVTYHFRIAATNDYGVVYGSDQSFSTLGPPLVSTLPATGVSFNSATLNGAVNPEGSPTTAWFQWGATTNYGSLTSLTDLGSGTTALPLSAPLAGLTPNVTYHFRIAATNEYGLACGGDQSLPTAALFSYTTNNGTITITGYTGPGGAVTIPDTINGLPVTTIGTNAFYACTSLASVTIPDSVTSLRVAAFYNCSSLTSVTIGSSVTNIDGAAFQGCSSLTSVTIPNSVTSIEDSAFCDCTSLTSVAIGSGITSIGNSAFWDCTSLTALHFGGNAPSLGGSYVFQGDNQAAVYYLPGTTGWGATFGGRPTALWIQVPSLLIPPRTQTAEAGSAVRLGVNASSPLPLFYLWYLNSTDLLSCSTNCELDLTNVQFVESGPYTVVISNVLGAVTSSPAILQVIAPVERRPVPGIKVTGQTGSLLNVDYASSLSPAPNWTPLGSVSLASTSGYCFDVTLPLPAQRFYRAWQTAPPSPPPTLDLHLVPAITLTGAFGSSVRLDYINRFGPIDAWVTLATATLTNTSQLYFDVSAPGQPERLYRLVPLP